MTDLFKTPLDVQVERYPGEIVAAVHGALLGTQSCVYLGVDPLTQSRKFQMYFEFGGDYRAYVFQLTKSQKRARFLDELYSLEMAGDVLLLKRLGESNNTEMTN